MKIRRHGSAYFGAGCELGAGVPPVLDLLLGYGAREEEEAREGSFDAGGDEKQVGSGLEIWIWILIFFFNFLLALVQIEAVMFAAVESDRDVEPGVAQYVERSCFDDMFCF